MASRSEVFTNTTKLDWLEVGGILFQEYANHGWFLCPIKAGEKAPRSRGWNEKENAVKSPEIASRLRAAGLCHAYSGTCALDIDDLNYTVAFMNARGLDISTFFLDPAMVRIDSGRPNRAKFLFALPEPLTSKTFANGAFELRCATSTGRTAQDVLPPSPHPSGTTYKWVGDWRNLPPLPEELKKLWESELQANSVVPIQAYSADLGELEALVLKRNPSCGYDDWIKIGMAIHHETEGSQDGFALWDGWSNKSDKYPGIEQLRTHWQSFGRSSTPITADSLRRTDTATTDEFDFLAPTTPERPPFQFMSLPELFNRPEPDWLIPGILPQKGLGSFWGQPGSGKTFLAVDIALTVAMKSHWRGTRVKKGGKALYIAAEDDSGVQVRFNSGLRARGSMDAPVRVLPAAPVFTSPKQAEALLKVIEAEGPQAITFVDTLAAVTPGADENTGKEMGPFIAFCKRIENVTGGIVILIHHDGKSPGKGPRGWSGLHGAFDVEWTVIDEKTHREMTITKMKSAPTGKGYVFHLAPVGKSCIVEWI
jgi:hypothetical protein